MTEQIKRGLPSRIPCLDGIRAFSILAVLLAHVKGTSGLPLQESSMTVLGDTGNLGVRIFFVVSGFLITHLLLRETTAFGRISLRDFFIRRVFRIFPAFYTYLAIIALLAAAGHVMLKWEDFGFAATYSINFVERKSWVVGHLWSLAVEEQFYLIWPALIVFAGWKRAGFVALLAVMAAPVLRIAVWYLLPEWRGIITKAFPTICDTIATGCLLAYHRQQLINWRPYAALLGSGFFWFVPVIILASNAIASHTRPDFLVGQTVRNIGIAVCIDWCMRNSNGRVGKVLNFRPVVWLGTLSYSLYLWQQLFLNRNSEALWCSFPLNVGLALGCACLSYYLVEQPCLRLRQRCFPGKPVLGRPAPSKECLLAR